ncbi:MAG: hypothetical protein AAGI69_27165 [Cyanobacteria bacterium P01_H01_bin.21]
MRKAALLISLMVVSAVAGGSFAYGWYSVTNSEESPQRHQSADLQDSDLDAPFDSSQSDRSEALGSMIENPQEISKQPSINEQLAIVRDNGQVSLTLDAPQLSQLVNDAVLNQPQVAQILANAQSLNTTLKGNSIETGTVVKLSELPRDGLSAEVQAGLDQLTSAAPMLANRDIYIGIVARPQIQDGEIRLDQDVSFRLGQFTLPLADVTEQMGFSTSEIERRLNDRIHQYGLTLETIEILDEQLVITGVRS